MKKEFYTANRQNVMQAVTDNSVVVLFAGEAPHMSADENYHFVPNRNFLYLTGIDREKIILVITKLNGEVKETLFIEKSDPVLAKWVGERMSEDEARAASGISQVQFLESFEGQINAMITGQNYENLYLDLERRAWNSPSTVSQRFAGEITKKYPNIVIKTIYNIIRDARVIKSQEEIENIEKAIGITYEGIRNMMKNARPGMMEYQIEAYYDFVLKTSGVKEVAFPTIAASGVNGTVLHYSDNNSRTNDGDLILFDLGAQYDYYRADISRTFPVNGKFTERQKTIYNIVLKALNDVVKAIKPDIPFTTLNEVCKKTLTEGLKEIGLIKEDSEITKYYYHGVSHYLGLDTHDVGSRNVDLKPGMVLTVEPGLYIEEEKIGIRIEDDVVVTENGCEVLSKDIIRTVDEIEKYMSR